MKTKLLIFSTFFFVSTSAFAKLGVQINWSLSSVKQNTTAIAIINDLDTHNTIPMMVLLSEKPGSRFVLIDGSRYFISAINIHSQGVPIFSPCTLTKSITKDQSTQINLSGYVKPGRADISCSIGYTHGSFGGVKTPELFYKQQIIEKQNQNKKEIKKPATSKTTTKYIEASSY